MDFDNQEKRQQLMKQIAGVLEQSGFFVETQPEKSIFRLIYTSNNVQYTCYIVIKFSIKEVFFYFVPPLTISKEFLLPVAEYITRINYGMTFGNFELDFSDGEINYKTTIRWRDQLFEMNEILDALESGVSMWSMYLPSLMSILEHGITPAEAIAQIRG